MFLPDSNKSVFEIYLEKKEKFTTNLEINLNIINEEENNIKKDEL